MRRLRELPQTSRWQEPEKLDAQVDEHSALKTQARARKALQQDAPRDSQESHRVLRASPPREAQRWAPPLQALQRMA